MTLAGEGCSRATRYSGLGDELNMDCRRRAGKNAAELGVPFHPRGELLPG
jgi:hypothetical protein